MFNRDAVFVDTSGWIAVLNADDALHQQACRQLVELGTCSRSLITTDWVLAETGNGLARTVARTNFAEAIARFLGSTNCRLVWVDQLLFERSLDLYNQMTDKAWGLVDCASFVVMRDQGIAAALSSDRHFMQAGFQCLLLAGAT